MSLIIRPPWTRQPQQAVEIDWSNQFWGGQKPLFLHSQSCGPFDLVNNTPLVVNGAPGRLIGSSGIALSSQSSGVSYDGLRVPEVVSGSRSDRLYNKAAPPLTLLTISVANGNAQLSLMRSNGSGSPAFGCGAWYGSNSGGVGVVRTTGGVLSLQPGGFLFDTRVTPIVTIFSIGPTTTRIFSGPIGTMALHVAEAATPTGNFYYEHGDQYRCLSVGGNYNSFAPASWLGAISATEVSSRAAAESLIRNPWQIFKPQPRRIWTVPSGGAVNGTGSGSLSQSNLSPVLGVGSSTSDATGIGSLDDISLQAILANASSSVTGSGLLSSISLSSVSGSAQASAQAVSALASIILTAISGSASTTGAGNAAGALSLLSLGSVNALANGSGNANTALRNINLTAPEASAFTGAVGSGELASLSLSGLTGNAAGNALVTAALRAISLGTVNASATSGAPQTLNQADIDAIVTALLTDPRLLTVAKFLALK